MAIPTYEGKYILYTSRIKSGMNGAPLLEATEVADLAQQKLQSAINAETLTALGDRYTKAEADKKISDAVAAIEIPEFSLPTASATVKGGVQIGSGISVTAAGVISVAAASASAAGLMSAADKAKLDAYPATYGNMRDEITQEITDAIGSIEENVANTFSKTDKDIAALGARIAALETALTLK